jgi:hypothetical protein
MSIYDEVLAANGEYAASFGGKGDLDLPPARHFAILTCMDARLDPAKYAGLSEGDSHVIRNAGGRASDDGIRSLVISYKLLGINERREWLGLPPADPADPADPAEYDRALRTPVPPKTLLQRFGVWMKWNLAILLAGAFGFLYEHLADE